MNGCSWLYLAAGSKVTFPLGYRNHAVPKLYCDEMVARFDFALYLWPGKGVADALTAQFSPYSLMPVVVP